jgi:lipopolysaccharide biosynthesis glycosyltransferase
MIKMIKAQARRFISDTNGQLLNITTTKSNYECFNECIKNSQCLTALRIIDQKYNCYLKTKYELYKNIPMDAEVFRVLGKIELKCET